MLQLPKNGKTILEDDPRQGFDARRAARSLHRVRRRVRRPRRSRHERPLSEHNRVLLPRRAWRRRRRFGLDKWRLQVYAIVLAGVLLALIFAVYTLKLAIFLTRRLLGGGGNKSKAE